MLEDTQENVNALKILEKFGDTFRKYCKNIEIN